MTDAEATVEEAKKALEEKEDEERQLNQKVEERKRKLAKRKGDVDWAKVNERAVQINQRSDREALKIKQGPSIAGSGKKDGEFNPYARRRVKPKILWEVGQGKEAPAEEGVSSAEAPGGKSAAPAAPNKEDMVDAPHLVQEANEKSAAVLADSHQFAIDEEGMVQIGPGKKSPLKQRVRKGLSLSDYLEQKAAGSL